MNLNKSDVVDDKMAGITQEPHLYVIFHNQDKADEEHEVTLVEVTEDRIVAAILSLFELIPSDEWRHECLGKLFDEIKKGSIPYPDTGMNTVQ